MSYVARYVQEISKKEIDIRLKKAKKVEQIPSITQASVGNFIQSNATDGYIHGKIAVKRSDSDYDFEMSKDYEITKTPHSIQVYDEVMFTIFPDIKVVSFSSKVNATLFGMEVLSYALFDTNGKIFGLTFYPQKVLEAKRNGRFTDVWFNGVRSEGKIRYTGQFGTEIDDDVIFIDRPDKREGIGVVFASRLDPAIKVGIYKDGSLLRHRRLKDFKDDILLEKEVIMAFIPYSNYGLTVPHVSSDKLTSLADYM